MSDKSNSEWSWECICHPGTPEKGDLEYWIKFVISNSNDPEIRIYENDSDPKLISSVIVDADDLADLVKFLAAKLSSKP